VLLNQLVNTEVKHVVLDSNIAARSVNLETLFMVDNYYFGGVDVPKETDCRFKGQVSLQVCHFKPFKVILDDRQEVASFCFSVFALLLKLSSKFFTNFFGFVLFLVSLIDCFLSSLALD